MTNRQDEIRIHVPGTPDVPDIIHPGDWITDDDHETFAMVVKVQKAWEGEWDYCPGAESWTIFYLGIGYMTGEKVSLNDCGFINNIVAEDGRLLDLYKNSHREIEIKLAKKPEYVTVSKSALSLINRSRQMKLF
jgi:hypothetical protein